MTARLVLLAGRLFAAAAISYAVLVVVTLLALRADQGQASYHQVRTVRIAVEGRVEVVGADRSDVAVTRTLRFPFAAPEVLERVDGDTLVVTARCRFAVAIGCSTDYLVAVPRSTAVVVRSSAGEVSAVGVSAGVDLVSSAGAVTAADVAGPVRLRSSAGSVRGVGLASETADAHSSAGEVTLSFAVPPRSVHATSSSGDVLVEVPAGVPYRVIASGPDDHSDVEVATDPGADRVIEARSSAGAVRIAPR